jgi:transcriptional regulator with XRE-family HTH domain
MSLQSKEDLIEKLRNKKFRDAFITSRVSNTLAFQIRALRQERGLSQTQLAKELSTSQNAICRLESPQYGRPSITTLKKLASLFDVGLAVWFVPFSELVDRFTNLSTESLLVPAFEEDIAKPKEAQLGQLIADQELLVKVRGADKTPIEEPTVDTRLLGTHSQSEDPARDPVVPSTIGYGPPIGRPFQRPVFPSTPAERSRPYAATRHSAR